MSNNKLLADATGIAAYSAHAAASAAHLAEAGGHAEAAGPELLGPVFGLIGSEFVQSYGTTHAAHVDSIARLSATLDSMGTGATTAATAFVGHDDAHAADIDDAAANTEQP